MFRIALRRRENLTRVAKGAGLPRARRLLSSLYLHISIYGCMHSARTWPTERRITVRLRRRHLSDAVQQSSRKDRRRHREGRFGSLTILFSSEGGNGQFARAVQFPDPASGPRCTCTAWAYRQRGSARLPRRQQTNLQPFARFFFHEYVWGFDGSSTLYQIDEATDLDFARKIMRSRAKLPSKILLCMGRRILRSSSRRRPRPMASSRISSSSARPARTAWASPCGRPDTR
jgi:hypothetical protein